RVDVEVQRLPERRSGLVHLRADIPLVSREATVRHADLPLARPDETGSLSAQTGGCEAHGHSALPERPRGRCEDDSHDAKRRPAPPHGGNPTSWTTAWNRGSARSGAQRRSRLSHTSQCVRSRTPCASHATALSLCPSAVCTSATAYAVTYCRRDRESMRISAAWASRR